VTQTAMFDGDFDVFRADWSEVDGFESHRLLVSPGNPSVTGGFTSGGNW
jgi:hypothetical protein